MLTLEQRAGWFWKKVMKSESCWAWTAYRDRHGYGYFCVQSGWPEHAHRVAWRLTYGNIPEGVYVLHKCDTPSCVRPDHLFLGTQADNMRDAKEKGRTCRGEDHPGHRLTEQQAQDIRLLVQAGGDSHETIARRFGISRRLVGMIARRERWKWLA